VSGDNRSVTTDALATLGTIIESGGRDAIHLAVNPTVAGEKLYPGQDVGVDGTRNNPVGIVDPFLKAPVLPGEMFWLVVYPRQINSLRHVWTHPAFPDESSFSKSESEQWLKQFMKEHDCDGEEDYANITSAASGEWNTHAEDLHVEERLSTERYQLIFGTMLKWLPVKRLAIDQSTSHAVARRKAWTEWMQQTINAGIAASSGACGQRL